MGRTTIEWTARYDEHGEVLSSGKTWNYVTGCEAVSPGCDHCYARTFAERWRRTPGHPYEQGFDLRVWEDRLTLPFHWKRPTTIFVNSMSDWCHTAIPEAVTLRAFEVMLQTPWHTYQLLTKRAPQMVRLVPRLTNLIEQVTGSRVWPSHLWLGVTVESLAQQGRLRWLQQVPARVHFLSYEPALGPLAGVDLSGIEWVIAGAESGRGARPMDEQWVRDLRDQCQAEKVAFFYKQKLVRGKKVPLPELDGKIWREYPVVGGM